MLCRFTLLKGGFQFFGQGQLIYCTKLLRKFRSRCWVNATPDQKRTGLLGEGNEALLLGRVFVTHLVEFLV